MRPNFKQDWTKEDFTMIDKAIVKHFQNKTIRTHHGVVVFGRSLKQIENVLGLPYTSTSAFAAKWASVNTHAYYPGNEKLKYNAFAITEDNKPFAILEDNEENETYIPL